MQETINSPYAECYNDKMLVLHYQRLSKRRAVKARCHGLTYVGTVCIVKYSNGPRLLFLAGPTP